MFGIKTKVKKYLFGHFGIFDDLYSIRISPIGYSCNHACLMCWRQTVTSKEKKDLLLNDSKKLTIQEYKKLFLCVPKSVKNVDIVGGGEPLLYPKIGELFKIIKQKNIYGRLITNGSLLNNTIINELVDCSWDEIRISFHAGSKKTYVKVNGVSDFDTVICNIQCLIEKRKTKKLPWISMLFVIQRDNIYDISRFARLAQSLRVDEVEFDTLIPTCDPHLLLTPEKKKYVIAELIKIKSELHIKHNIEHVLEMFSKHPLWSGKKRDKRYYKNRYCQHIQSNIDISCEGLVVPCCMAYGYYEYANIREKLLVELWRDSRLFRMKLVNGKFYSFCYKNCNYELAKK